MPIFEFKCTKCQEYMEILVMGTHDDSVEMKCTKCGSEELERILSRTNFAMAPGASALTTNAASGSASARSTAV